LSCYGTWQKTRTRLAAKFNLALAEVSQYSLPLRRFGPPPEKKALLIAQPFTGAGMRVIKSTTLLEQTCKSAAGSHELRPVEPRVLTRVTRDDIFRNNMAEHPTGAWTAQQIVEAFADRDAAGYLFRQRDSRYSAEVDCNVRPSTFIQINSYAIATSLRQMSKRRWSLISLGYPCYPRFDGKFTPSKQRPIHIVCTVS
jgi:hypothetical protein